jgi:hypothetical protein
MNRYDEDIMTRYEEDIMNRYDEDIGCDEDRYRWKC